MITNNVTQLIGNTPLIKLKYPSEISGCEIYGKAEFMNPAGSVKDRTAPVSYTHLTLPTICSV